LRVDLTPFSLPSFFHRRLIYVTDVPFVFFFVSTTVWLAFLVVPGDYFGEMALMLDEPRHANCIAVNGPVKALKLSKNDFLSMFGPLQALLEKQMRLRILKSVPLLAILSDDELSKVSECVMLVYLMRMRMAYVEAMELSRCTRFLNSYPVACALPSFCSCNYLHCY